VEIGFLVETTRRLLSGVPLMLQLWALSVAIGALLAVAVALLRLSGVKPLEWLASFYVFVFRGTPLLVQMFLIYYGLSQFPEIRQSFLWVFLREPYWCAIIAFILNTAAYGSEIVRGGLLAVPFGEVEAARAFGMSGLLLFRRVIFPIALRQALPAYGNEIILMIKATSLASIITLMEVTGIAQRLISETFRAVEVFICAGAIYLVINFIISRAVAWLEHRLSPHLRDITDRQTPSLLSAEKI
jgi:octopine/nopaline transport system permease protein